MVNQDNYRRWLMVMAAARAAASVALLTEIEDEPIDYTSLGIDFEPPNGEQLADYFVFKASDTTFKDTFRMTKTTLLALEQRLKETTYLVDSEEISVRQKLMIFVWICAFNETQRNARLLWNHSTKTISSAVHELLKACQILFVDFVRPKDKDVVSNEVALDSKRWPYFKDCIGAIDGTFVYAFVPEAVARVWRSRKNETAQNVLAVVNFDGTFAYVLAGCEGSMHDDKVVRIAENHGFNIPEGKYLLADAAFSQGRGMLVPYEGTRYHLREWGAMNERPRNYHELFNLRHSSLRVTVERVFGTLKRKWKIIRTSAPEYSIADQILFVYSITAIHNFIASTELVYAEEDDDGILAFETEFDVPPSQRSNDGKLFDGPSNEASREDYNQLRENIAMQMWEDYCIYHGQDPW